MNDMIAQRTPADHLPGPDAAYISPVPLPGPDAVAPEPYPGIYAMPMFVTAATEDLDASVDFWIRGLGFFNLFEAPGRMAHLRRWAFQDVLLVPAARAEAPGPLTVTFACVLGQLEAIAAACAELAPGSVEGPVERPWNSVELTVTAPEGTRVVMSAARPLDLGGEAAAFMRESGITVPEE